MNFQNLFRKKSVIEAEIAARKASALEAVTALDFCDQLKTELPARIAALKAEPVEIQESGWHAVEDFTGRGDLTSQIRQIAAASALLADLPDIRKHWEAVAAARA